MNAPSERELRRQQTNGDAAPDSTDLDHHKFNVTFFPSQSATTKKCRIETLPELRDRILKTRGPTKLKLPWLKLATFGNVRSEMGCLRTNANVLSIEGIELDYDGLEMSFEEAVETVRRMGVRALLYTSPSYNAATLKWRLLMPLSKSETRLEMREKYVARVNGFFGNIFAGESFTLSLAYLYGKANDNPDPDHQAIIIDGDFLDLRDDLYKYEASGAKKTSNGVTSYNNEPLPDWLMRLLKTDPGGGLSNDPVDLPDLASRAEVNTALSVLNDSNIRRNDWLAIGCGLYKNFGEKVAREIFENWSSPSPNYNSRTFHKQWCSIVRGDGYGWNIGTLFYLADKADPNWRSNIEPEESESVEETSVEEVADPVEKEQPHDQGETKTDAKPELKTEPKPASIEPDAGALIISSRKFMADFKPPDYLIDGVLQRRFLYSMTALTHAGKTNVALRLAAHVALGLPLGDREIEQGKVLFFAGENPDDVRMRWRKLCEEMNTDEETDQVFWVAGIYSIKKLRKVIDAQTTKCGPFALIVIDSAAAYFGGAGGAEENDNTEYGNFARMLRTLVEIYGGPTILVICHPVKNASLDNLIPRGGGAFLNEVDGNLVLKVISEAPKVVDLHWQGKFRGPEFAPIPFMIIPGYSERIKDSRGRPISTVYAKPLNATERAVAEDQGETNQDKLLSAMKAKEGATLVELAKLCGWYYKTGEPNKSLANRTMHDLEARRLVKLEGGRWKLTKAGLATDTESI